MEFKARTDPLFGRQLDELVSVVPRDEAYKQGFTLQDPEVDDILRTAKDIETASVQADPSLSADANVNILLCAVKVLQLALEFQFKESEDLANMINDEQQRVAALEMDLKLVQDDYVEVRAQREQDKQNSDVEVLRERIADLEQQLEAATADADRLQEQLDMEDQNAEENKEKLEELQEQLTVVQRDNINYKRDLSKVIGERNDIEKEFKLFKKEVMEERRRRMQDDSQRDWVMERQMKDNNDLKTENAAMLSKLKEIREENLEYAKKIVMLDEKIRKLELGESDLQ